MKKEVPTPNVLLDKTKKRKDGKCPIYISVTINHTRAKEATGVYMTEQEFQKGRWKTSSVLLKRLSEIEEVISTMKPPYNAQKILFREEEKTYFSTAIEKGKRQHLNPLTVKNLTGAGKVLEKYLGEVRFQDVSDDDLRYLTRKMKEDGYKIGGISTVMKNLKSVFSYAEKMNYIRNSPFRTYNFKKEGYRFIDNPKALSRSTVTLIIRHWEKFHTTGCGIWLFSYYFGGLSLVDIMKEDWNDINVEVYKGSSYYTKIVCRSKSNEKAHIVVQRNRYTTDVLEFIRTKPWGNDSKDYFATKCNKELKEIDKDITLYTARHTFCTQLVNSHIPLSHIASMMGRSPNTLATYIRRLTEESDLSRAADAIYKIELFEE